MYSPYRICPLGAHIDHQLGIVLGTTINRGIHFRFLPNKEKKVRLHSLDYGQNKEFSISDVSVKTGDWSDYARGAVWVLKKYGKISSFSPGLSGGRGDLGRKNVCSTKIRYGIDAEIKADFPGGGLGSSSAIAVAYLLALERVNNLQISAEENIKLIQKLENEYIGLNNGIMDQSIILLTTSLPNSMVYLDCKTFEHKIISPLYPTSSSTPALKLPEADRVREIKGEESTLEVALVYSGISRVLSDTNYNRRVAECEEAAKILTGKVDTKLRDVPEEVFLAYKNRLPENLRKRAIHFFTEMKKVQKGAVLWEKGDFKGFGKLMTESGRSSIENYECGTSALIRIYELLNSVDGVYGARFSGAGFRGSCIGLIKPSEDVKDAIREKIENYKREFLHYAEGCQIAFCKTNIPVKN